MSSTDKKTILDKIKVEIKDQSVIPKPETKNDFIVKGWGRRRGENALIYQIPNHQNPERPYEKGITESEWVRAYNQLMKTGYFDREWFDKNLPACSREGGCNFTTIGGIFVVLKLAKYAHRGVYEKSRSYQDNRKR